MSKVLELFKKVVSGEGWSFDEIPDVGHGLETIVFGLSANYRKMLVEITDEPTEKRVMVRCRMHDNVPDEKLDRVFSLMNTMNLTRWFTRLSVDMDKNELVFSRPLSYDSLRMTQKAADGMLLHAIEVADCDTEWLFKELAKTTDAAAGEVEFSVTTRFGWKSPRNDN